MAGRGTDVKLGGKILNENDNEEKSRTEKDLKSVYKKIKRNKKYFISIKDVVVLDSLIADGVSLPVGLDYETISSQLTVPKNLEDLVQQKQIGLVVLYLGSKNK